MKAMETYEKHGLPTTMHPEVLQRAVDTYGKDAQTDMAIEEMSELTKALLKHRRAQRSQKAWDHEKAWRDIHEEIADVIVMLIQLLMIHGGREEVEKNIESKVSRLEERLGNAAKGAGEEQEETDTSTAADYIEELEKELRKSKGENKRLWKIIERLECELKRNTWMK